MIIGSGIAGLAASIRLAAKGYKVIVLESNGFPGGKLSEFSGLGFRFDAGPSLFTMPDLVTELLQLGNKDTYVPFSYTRLESICHYFYPSGKRFTAPGDLSKLTQSLVLNFDEDPAKVRRFLEKSAWLYRTTSPIFLENSLHKFKTYFSLKGIRGILNLGRIDMFRSMNQAIMASFRNPDTVQLFNRYATYNGSSPYKAPATLNVIPYLETGLGAWFPTDGMQSITTALFKKAQLLGVQFVFNTRVSRILHNKKAGVTGVEDSHGNIYDASIVVSNADAKKTYSQLLQSEIPTKIKKAENSSSALIFYWGIKHSFPELGLHNIFFSKDYRSEFKALFETKTLYSDPTVYINITSKLKSDDAPSGSENWFVMINAPANYGQDWEMLRKQAKSSILTKLSAVLGTDIERLIEWEDYLDPVRIEERTGSDKGSLYGSSSNSRMSAFFRQSNFSSSIKGLFFCGGSVHPGGGIPLCLLGARIVSNLIPENNEKY